MPLISLSSSCSAVASLGILLEMQSLRPTLEYTEGSLYLGKIPSALKLEGALDHKAILAKRLLLSRVGTCL